MSKVVLDERYMSDLLEQFERWVRHELDMKDDDNYTGNKLFIVETAEEF